MIIYDNKPLLRGMYVLDNFEGIIDHHDAIELENSHYDGTFFAGVDKKSKIVEIPCKLILSESTFDNVSEAIEGIIDYYIDHDEKKLQILNGDNSLPKYFYKARCIKIVERKSEFNVLGFNLQFLLSDPHRYYRENVQYVSNNGYIKPQTYAELKKGVKIFPIISLVANDTINRLVIANFNNSGSAQSPNKDMFILNNPQTSTKTKVSGSERTTIASLNGNNINQAILNSTLNAKTFATHRLINSSGYLEMDSRSIVDELDYEDYLEPKYKLEVSNIDPVTHRVSYTETNEVVGYNFNDSTIDTSDTNFYGSSSSLFAEDSVSDFFATCSGHISLGTYPNMPSKKYQSGMVVLAVLDNNSTVLARIEIFNKDMSGDNVTAVCYIGNSIVKSVNLSNYPAFTTGIAVPAIRRRGNKWDFFIGARNNFSSLQYIPSLNAYAVPNIHPENDKSVAPILTATYTDLTNQYDRRVLGFALYLGRMKNTLKPRNGFSISYGFLSRYNDAYNKEIDEEVELITDMLVKGDTLVINTKTGEVYKNDGEPLYKYVEMGSVLPYFEGKGYDLWYTPNDGNLIITNYDVKGY